MSIDTQIVPVRRAKQRKTFYLVDVEVTSMMRLAIPASAWIDRESRAKDEALDLVMEAIKTLPLEPKQPPIIVEADRIVQTVTREV
jgi:hypothetical protein